MEYFDKFKSLTSIKSYDEQNSLSLAIACDLAYQDESKISTTIQLWGWELIDFIHIKKGFDIDIQCYLMCDEKNIVVVFRGSDSHENWVANFQATQDPGPLKHTWVHKGFQDSLYPAVISLSKHVRDAVKSQKKVWITGHSLGGALCSLYAGMLIENDFEVYGIYTFASPRPASPNFEQQLNKKVIGPHYRVVNDGDVVPHLPSEPFFSHCGKRIILKSMKKETSKKSWWKQRVNALEHFVQTTGEKFDVGDIHRLSACDGSYIPRLIEDLNRVQ